MTDTGLANLFQTQFSTLLQMKLQQKTSLLRGRVMEGAHAGSKMASPIQFVGPMSMHTPEGRFAPIKNTAADYSRRWIVPIDKDGAQLVDTFDQLKTPIDPKSQLVARAAAACARQWDDEIIRAATADATIGTDAGSLTTESFDTTATTSGGFRVADDFGATAAVGLTVAKLNETRRVFEHYHALEDGMRPTLVIGSKQHSDLRNQAQVTSSDFNGNGGVLVSGVVTQYMGFDITVSERLPVYTTNTRGCLAFVKDGMYLGTWQDVKTQVDQRKDLSSLPWQIYTQISFGATRVQAGKVIQIACLDSTGADITV